MSTTGLGSVWRYRELLGNLVRRDLQVKYKGSSLGFAWSLLHPLIMAAVYTLAFRYVLRIPIERFPLFLLSGLLPWMFLVTAVTTAATSIGDHGTLVRRVAFPRLVLPLASVASQGLQFALMYTVILPLAVLDGPGLSPTLLAIVPLILLQLAFAAGLGLLAATAYVFFRDTRHLIEVAFPIWFWLTPIVYSMTLVPPELARYLRLNPMTWFVMAYQGAIIDHRWPSWPTFAAIALLAAASLGIGYSVFQHQQRRFAELV